MPEGTPRWFDTHAHLSDAKFDPDRSEVIDRALSDSIAGIMEIADGPSEWEKARALAERYPGRLWWSAGIHPYYADQATASHLATLKELTRHPQFRAIGEVGLDYFKCGIPPSLQQDTFKKTLELALSAGKPLIIHCREAFPDLRSILRTYFGTSRPNSCPGVIHCFSGGDEDAADLIGLGFYLGVDGPVTYPGSQALRATLRKAGLENMVLETDSPYLPPQGLRGQRNEPHNLSLIGPALSELFEKSALETSAILNQNSRRLFRLETI